MPRWDETWHRLREWTNGQGPSERLAAQVLSAEGFESIDPSHPLGGQDGGQDAICLRDGQPWTMAVYFPRGEQRFNDVKQKFLDDLEGARSAASVGIAFVTNQELRLSERSELRERASPFLVGLFHLERLTAVLDRPDMAPIRNQFLGMDEDTPATSILGGEGGNALGAGGGGGAALGIGTRGGDGGRGGDIRLEGLSGQAPGAGGGGAGAIGLNAEGGEGGQGGEFVIAQFLAKDLPSSIPIKIGRGGRGGKGTDGEDGEDSYLGDLLRIKGGRGGRAGKIFAYSRDATASDVEKGLSLCGIYLAECAHLKNGLLYLLSAGWSYYQVAQTPLDAHWPLICTFSMGDLELGTLLEFDAVVSDPSGMEVKRERFAVARGEQPGVSMSHVFVTLRFSISVGGIWKIAVTSGDVTLGLLPIEIKLST